ncbi:GNAT family N-acetyltransferase [Aurantibacillus circumpalustris]|uniref:GNAT family N-acetyltransferase n=1 Tax=Aurantibacillus circumpalustris TaxID=3036359 RepID=UPI00295AF8FC|nr:GNAT family N-acetyltransferase [Aurantibacillus circumpalustris]
MQLIPITESEDKNNELYQSSSCQDLLTIYKDFYKSIGYKLPWVGYFIFKNEKIVGSCGFKGAPKNKKVEIAYWTFSENEKQGIATEACRLLVELALKTDSKVIISAQTLPEENASTSILKKNGFVFTGETTDEEVGVAWEWIYKK